MDAQDKITKQMQEAARNAESQSFPGMDRVWEKVTERLDGKPENKAVPFFSYKRIAAAAAVLIAIGLGTTYLLNEGKPENNIAGTKSVPKVIPQHIATEPENVIAAAEPVAHAHNNPVAMKQQAVADNNISENENHDIVENASAPAVSYWSSAPVAAPPPLAVPSDMIKVKGQVVDENGEALIGAEIRLKGTSTGTWTDVDGNYELDVTATDPQLEISYMGYDTRDISIAGNYDPGVTRLAPGAGALTNVVAATSSGSPAADKDNTNTEVVTIEKLSDAPVRDVAKVIEGSVPGVQNAGSSNTGILSIQPNIVSNNTTTNLTAGNANLYKENQYTLSQNYSTNGYSSASMPYSNYKRQQSYTVNAPVTDITKAIEGAAPGVQVMNGNGRPGAGASVQVRGKSSGNAGTAPLIILNGVPYDSDITTIKPEDIASVNILKDAKATSLYGARGANGVIIINTKNDVKKSGTKADKKKQSGSRQLFKK